MTRSRIADGLVLVVELLGHPGPLPDPPNGWDRYEWAYVKGLASGAILRLANVAALGVE